MRNAKREMNSLSLCDKSARGAQALRAGLFFNAKCEIEERSGGDTKAHLSKVVIVASIANLLLSMSQDDSVY